MHFSGKWLYTFMTIFVVGFSAQGQEIDRCLIFNALKVPAKRSEDAVVKFAGAIRCQKVEPDCHCFLVPGGDQTAYTALQVPEVDVTPRMLTGSKWTEKRVGDLVCLKQQSVTLKAKAHYQCDFEIQHVTRSTQQGRE